MEVPFDVSHAGQLRLIKQSLCTNGSEFRWGGLYTHFITFCQKAQWNVCGTLFLCMSPSMEFLIVDVATRSPLMSFVKDNYGLSGMAREGMKSWLCVVWVDVALRPLLLSIPCVWPGLHVRKNPGLCSIINAVLEADWSTPAPLPFAYMSPTRSQYTRLENGTVTLVCCHSPGNCFFRPQFLYSKSGIRVSSSLLSNTIWSIFFAFHHSSLTNCWSFIVNGGG